MVNETSQPVSRAAIFLGQLSQTALRKLSLQWDDLVELHGFTGNHLTWHKSAPHIMGPRRVPSAPLPPSEVGSRHIHYGPRKYETQETPASYEDKLKARQSDPAVIDAIGVKETTALAEARFNGIVREYFSWWSTSSARDSVEFARTLEQFRQFVVDEVHQLWINSRWHSDWFDRACREAVEGRLKKLGKNEATRARRFEMQHLDAETERARLHASGAIVGPDQRTAAAVHGTTLAQTEESIPPSCEPKNRAGAVGADTVLPAPMPRAQTEEIARLEVGAPRTTASGSEIEGKAAAAVPEPEVANGPEAPAKRLTFEAALSEAENLASNAKERRQFRIVTLYDMYLRELKILKAQRGNQPKKASERTTLKQSFPWCNVWKVMNAEEIAQIETIRKKEFIPSRWALSLACVHGGLTGLTGRTVINYRKSLNAVKKARSAP